MRKFTETARENIFWLMDALKGSPVKRHYTDIALLLNTKNERGCFQHALKNAVHHFVRSETNGKMPL